MPCLARWLRFGRGPGQSFGTAGALLLAAGWLGWPAGPARASVTLDLDGTWLFRTDPHGEGEALGWTRHAPDGARPVTVPNSWALGPDQDYLGTAWYFRELVLPAGFSGLHQELRFGATFYRSTVWVNGRLAGRHEGGFTAYALDVSALLHPGLNEVAVAIDNRPGVATIPGYALRQRASGSVWYDWWRNGGIVRPVSLVASQGGLIRRQAIVAALSAGPGPAQVAVTPLVENVTDTEARFRLDSVAFAPDGTRVAEASASVAPPPHQAAAATLSLAVRNPVLWNVGAARLYRIVTTLSDATGLVLDRAQDETGLRSIAIHDRHLLVNGHPVRLTGLARHEDSPWEGLAETRGTILQDWDTLAALHTTLTRPVHYPQPPEVLEQADRQGILLIPEIPVWQMTERQLADPALRALARAMMTEMIEQDGNHPSIIGWSVCNESDARLPGGTGYVRMMKALINRLDPGRLVSFADADVAIAPWRDAPILHEVDLIMANAYFGSWDGPAGRVEPWLDFMDRTYPDKMLLISEFGWPGVFSAGPAAADRDRIANIDSQLDAFQKRDFVAGAILWSYQDYRSPRNLPPGQTDGTVDHGLVDADRQRKPSFRYWERRNRPLSLSLSWTDGAAGPTGFSAALQANPGTLIPSYPLIGARLRWRLSAPDGTMLAGAEQPLPDLAPGAPPFLFHAGWTARPPSGASLAVAVLTPTGIVASSGDLTHDTLRIGAAPFLPADAQGAQDR